MAPPGLDGWLFATMFSACRTVWPSGVSSTENVYLTNVCTAVVKLVSLDMYSSVCVKRS